MYNRVMAGEGPPSCFNCKEVSTHVSTNITPAGYNAWKCAAHVPRTPTPLWGSDPGWQTYYETVESARARFKPDPDDCAECGAMDTEAFGH